MKESPYGDLTTGKSLKERVREEYETKTKTKRGEKPDVDWAPFVWVVAASFFVFVGILATVTWGGVVFTWGVIAFNYLWEHPMMFIWISWGPVIYYFFFSKRRHW